MKKINSVFLLLIVACCGSEQSLAQITNPCPSPDTFLPSGNVQNSLAGVVRIYKVDADGKIGRQPPSYPKTVADPTKPFEMADDEAPRIHEGIDYSSYGRDRRTTPLEFKAGIHGTIKLARNGMIAIQVDDAENRVEFLHNSTVAKEIVNGTKVTPETILGKTGNLNPSSGKNVLGMGIHLHVQARNKAGEALNPCEVVPYASKPFALRKEAEFFTPMKWVDLKPIKSIDWGDFKDEPQNQSGGRLIFDENVPKKK